MPSTYSPSLKLELIGTGEQAGTWGVTTNNNLGTLLEQAITGVITLNMGDATYTMTNYNGLSDEARNAVLMLNGPITSPQALIMPPQQKVYIVRNRTGNTVTLSANVGGVNVSIANAASEVLFCDGSNVYSATQFNYINGDLTVTGTAYANNFVATNNITLGTDLFGNASTGQVYLPKGNTSSRTSAPINGLIRYNETGKFYEGYQNNVWVRFITAPQGEYSISYLIVAGGGGGADIIGVAGSGQGGGGGGGYVANTFTATSGTVYTIVVGAGGTQQGTGVNSYISGIQTAYGGGGGNGGAGGSGGGGVSSVPGGGIVAPGQGNVGGDGSAFWGSGGGGGGGGAPGGVGSNIGGNGGAGVSNTLLGTTTYYAGGGAGCGPYPGEVPGTPGVGGGGGYGTAGTVNTGGGGGGGRAGGGQGGSGIVILSIPTVSFSGTYTGLPIVTTVGSNTVLQFTQSGTYTSI